MRPIVTVAFSGRAAAFLRQLAVLAGRPQSRQRGPVEPSGLATAHQYLFAVRPQLGSGNVQSVITPIQGDQLSCAHLYADDR